MDTTTRLLFLRHAEVDPAFHRVFGGRIDMGLSPRGVQQAARLAEYLRRHPITTLYASPMQRVQQTITPLREALALEPVVMPGLREVDFGAWTGLRWDQIIERYGVTAHEWLELLERGGIPDAESPDLFAERVGACLRQILEESAGRTVAVACHGGVIRMALAVLLNLPLGKMTHFEVEYTSVTWLDCSTRKRELQLQNFTPWRDL